MLNVIMPFPRLGLVWEATNTCRATRPLKINSLELFCAPEFFDQCQDGWACGVQSLCGCIVVFLSGQWRNMALISVKELL